MKVIYLGSNEKKYSGKDPNKIESRLAENKGRKILKHYRKT